MVNACASKEALTTENNVNLVSKVAGNALTDKPAKFAIRTSTMC